MKTIQKCGYLDKEVELNVIGYKKAEDGKTTYIVKHDDLVDLILNEEHCIENGVSYHSIDIPLHERGHYVVRCIIADNNGRRVEGIGETIPKTLHTDIAKDYAYLMADKRAFDAAAIKFLRFDSKVYGEEEIMDLPGSGFTLVKGGKSAEASDSDKKEPAASIDGTTASTAGAGKADAGAAEKPAATAGAKKPAASVEGAPPSSAGAGKAAGAAEKPAATAGAKKPAASVEGAPPSSAGAGKAAGPAEKPAAAAGAKESAASVEGAPASTAGAGKAAAGAAGSDGKTANDTATKPGTPEIPAGSADAAAKSASTDSSAENTTEPVQPDDAATPPLDLVLSGSAQETASGGTVDLNSMLGADDEAAENKEITAADATDKPDDADTPAETTETENQESDSGDNTSGSEEDTKANAGQTEDEESTVPAVDWLPNPLGEFSDPSDPFSLIVKYGSFRSFKLTIRQLAVHNMAALKWLANMVVQSDKALECKLIARKYMEELGVDSETGSIDTTKEGGESAA